MHISNRRGTWVLSYSNALRREVQYRPASKPSQSAFAGSPKHGWNFIVQSVGIFTERRFGLLRKRQLPWLSCRELLRIKGGNASLPWVCVGQTGNRVKRGDRLSPDTKKKMTSTEAKSRTHRGLSFKGGVDGTRLSSDPPSRGRQNLSGRSCFYLNLDASPVNS
jgi:hypothetical protein